LARLVENTYPDTSTLDCAQADLYFIITIGRADFGVQHYYGRLTTPAVSMAWSLASVMAAVSALASTVAEGALYPPPLAEDKGLLLALFF
jgi:hypothetical protein